MLGGSPRYGAVRHGGSRKEGRPSFLKKRSKKLLLIASTRRAKRPNQVLTAIDKSFLLLFFKKEGLPSS
jgi:hypothetical protein